MGNAIHHFLPPATCLDHVIVVEPSGKHAKAKAKAKKHGSRRHEEDSSSSSDEEEREHDRDHESDEEDEDVKDKCHKKKDKKCKPKPKPKPDCSDDKRKRYAGIYQVSFSLPDTGSSIPETRYGLLTLQPDGTATLEAANQYSFPTLDVPVNAGAPPTVLLTSFTGTWRYSEKSRRICLELFGYSAQSDVAPAIPPAPPVVGRPAFLLGEPRKILTIKANFDCVGCPKPEILKCNSGCGCSGSNDVCPKHRFCLKGRLSITRGEIVEFPCPPCSQAVSAAADTVSDIAIKAERVLSIE